MQTNAWSSADAAVRQPTHDDIASAAYHLYLEQGSQHGHDLDDWLRAEQLLLQELNDAAPPGGEDPPTHDKPNAGGIQILDPREYPLARDERGSPDRSDIRRRTTSFRPAPRQSRSGHENRMRAAVSA